MDNYDDSYSAYLKYREVICCLDGDRSWIPFTEEHSFFASTSRPTAARLFSYPIRPHLSHYTKLAILPKLLLAPSHMGKLELPFDN